MRASTCRVTFSALLAILGLSIVNGAVPSLAAGEDEPERGIRIVLSVYSGRDNPQWWITDGPEFDELVRFLREPRPAQAASFEYDRWNRLGFSSFWILPKGIDGLPFGAHLWRDQAIVFVDGKGKESYQTLGSLPVYDSLVGQAMQREEEAPDFFASYLEFKAAREAERE